MIAKIRSMRKLSKEFRMQADSLQEIRKGLDRMAFDLGDFRVGSRPVSEGHVINAALLLMLEMPEEQRRAAACSAFEKLNALLAMDEPGDSGVFRAPAAPAPEKGPTSQEIGPGEVDLGSGGKRSAPTYPQESAKRRPKKA